EFGKFIISAVMIVIIIPLMNFPLEEVKANPSPHILTGQPLFVHHSIIKWCGGWDSNPRRPTPRDSTPAFCQGINRSDAFAVLGLECSARVLGATRPFSQMI